MTLVYPAIFEPWKGDEEYTTTGYTVTVPDLPGCVTEGEDLVDAIRMGEDAASGWILDELEDGKAIPDASNPKDIKPDENAFVSLLVLDIDTYAEKYSERSVRKNLTIPAWLNTYAEQNNFNFSKSLRDTLTEAYMKDNPRRNKK